MLFVEYLYQVTGMLNIVVEFQHWLPSVVFDLFLIGQNFSLLKVNIVLVFFVHTQGTKNIDNGKGVEISRNGTRQGRRR